MDTVCQACSLDRHGGKHRGSNAGEWSHNSPNILRCGTVNVVLIEIIVAVGAAAAAVGAIVAGQHKPDPALIPIPVKRPRRSSDD